MLYYSYLIMLYYSYLLLSYAVLILNLSQSSAGKDGNVLKYCFMFYEAC